MGLSPPPQLFLFVQIISGVYINSMQINQNIAQGEKNGSFEIWCMAPFWFEAVRCPKSFAINNMQRNCPKIGAAKGLIILQSQLEKFWTKWGGPLLGPLTAQELAFGSLSLTEKRVVFRSSHALPSLFIPTQVRCAIQLWIL